MEIPAAYMYNTAPSHKLTSVNVCCSQYYKDKLKKHQIIPALFFCLQNE